MLEFALVLFLLLLLLVGVVDFARAFYTYNVLVNASREGARYGSKFSHDEDNIRKWTKAEAEAGGVVLEDANIDITPYPDPDDAKALPGEPITVTVSYDVDTIIGGIAGFDTIPVRARTMMVVFAELDF
jgi:hypothetical protein